MNEESRKELEAYRALEMARDRSIPMSTIFRSTGGYRQSVVDMRNNSKAEEMPKKKKTTAHKKKAKRITKAERLRQEALATAPAAVVITSDGAQEVEICVYYAYEIAKRFASIRADLNDSSEPASPQVSFSNPADIRRIADALNAAADWMDGDSGGEVVSEKTGQELVLEALSGVLHDFWFEENLHRDADLYAADFRRFCEDKLYHILKRADK